MRAKEKLSEADVAYEILEEAGQPMYFRQLISLVLDGKEEVNEYSWAHMMAEIHTQINMDSRFWHKGKGMWGLSAWEPQTGVKSYVFEENVSNSASERKKRREQQFESIQEDFSKKEGRLKEEKSRFSDGSFD